MAANHIADSSFVVAYLNDRDTSHDWAVLQAQRLAPPWKTCEAALSEAFYVLGAPGAPPLLELIQVRAVVCTFDFSQHADAVTRFITKYRDVPMSFADACLVRMTEILSDPVLLTTDSDFRIYRRHGRQVVPCVMPR
jgi:predicted nucleic acid-binding protein